MLVRVQLRKHLKRPDRNGRLRDLPGGWLAKTTDLAVEIAVSNPKDDSYIKEVVTAGTLSVLEISLDWPHVREESLRLGKEFRDTIAHMVLKQASPKTWLFRKGVGHQTRDEQEEAE